MDFCNRNSTILFSILETSFFQKRSSFFFNSLSIFKSNIKRIQRKLFFSSFFYKLFLQKTHFLNKFFSFCKSTKHYFFRNFVCTTFYHCKTVFCTSNNNFHISFFNLLESRIDYIFTVQKTNTTCSNRTMKRNVRNTSSSRSSKNSKNILSMFTISRNTSRNNLQFMTKRRFKKRTHRTVNKTTYQNFLILRTTFTLYKTTRNFSRSIKFFIVLNSNRHKILTFCYSAGSTNCCNNGSSAPLSVNTTISLLTDFTSFQDKISITKSVSNSFYSHIFLLNKKIMPGIHHRFTYKNLAIFINYSYIEYKKEY